MPPLGHCRAKHQTSRPGVCRFMSRFLGRCSVFYRYVNDYESITYVTYMGFNWTLMELRDAFNLCNWTK